MSEQRRDLVTVTMTDEERKERRDAVLRAKAGQWAEAGAQITAHRLTVIAASSRIRESDKSILLHAANLLRSYSDEPRYRP